MLMCSDALMLRCSNTQILRYTEAKMPRCSCAQISRCSYDQIFTRSDVYMLRCSETQMFTCFDAQICTCSDAQMFTCSNVEIGTYHRMCSVKTISSLETMSLMKNKPAGNNRNKIHAQHFIGRNCFFNLFGNVCCWFLTCYFKSSLEHAQICLDSLHFQTWIFLSNWHSGWLTHKLWYY